MAIDWTKLPSLTALRDFEAAAQTGSFSQAARSLNVTHAAVAQQVRALEEHLGLKLFERSARGVQLTAEGSELARTLVTGFALIAQGVEALQDKNRNRPLRVTTTAFFAESVIFPKIADFWKQHSDIEISFTPSDEPIDLVAQGLDIGIRAGRGPWPGLRCLDFVQSPTRALAAPSLVDDPGVDWSQVPWLIPDSSTWEREALSQSGIDARQIKTVDLGNPALEIRAGEEGMGLVLEAEIDVRAQLAAGSLKIAPIPITHVSRFFIVTPPWTPRPPVAAFIAWLRALAPQLSATDD